jgi:Tfp pilus assembly protein PilF
MKTAISMDPEEPEAYYLIGHAFKKQGQREESMAAFTKLVQLQPHYAYLLK